MLAHNPSAVTTLSVSGNVAGAASVSDSGMLQLVQFPVRGLQAVGVESLHGMLTLCGQGRGRRTSGRLSERSGLLCTAGKQAALAAKDRVE